jgi:hypothetical protein
VIGIWVLNAAIRTGVVGRISREDLEGVTFFQVQATMGLVYLKHWVHFFFPYPHEPFLIRQEPVPSPLIPAAAAAWGTILVLFAAAFRWRRVFPYLLFGVLWFHFAYLPNSNLVFTGTYSAERYLYMPSVGWAVIVAGLIVRFRFARWAIWGILVAFAGVTFLRVPIWKDESSILAHSLSVAPADPYLVGKDIMRRIPAVDFREKRRLLNLLIQNPVWKMEGVEEWSAVLIDEGRFAEALRVLTPYVETSGRPVLLHNWALAFCQEHPETFEEELGRIGFKHRSGTVFTQLGICLAQRGRFEEAKRVFYRALVYGGEREDPLRYIETLKLQETEN